MASTKSKVFRASGVPENNTEAEIESMIHDFLDGDEKKSFKITVSFIPSCEEYSEPCAIVEFKGGHPKFLAYLETHPFEDCTVEMGGMDVNFDLHFLGFTQLYATSPGQTINADIIAITNDHAYGSWRSESNLGRMWLRDFCSRDLPNCRTMIYGYTPPLSSNNFEKIMDYGREFLDKIKGIRYTKESMERPIIFIAHSFGGIILAHCFLRAAQTNDKNDPIIAALHKSTYAILFFSTPHKGMVIDDIQRRISSSATDHLRQNLLSEIQLKSDVLKYQLVDFKNLIGDRKIVSFYETQQTRRMEMNPETKTWARTGEYMTAVEADSALLGLPDNMETKIKVDADHTHIVKFNNQNHQTYKQVIRYLRKFEKDAGDVVYERFNKCRNTCTIRGQVVEVKSLPGGAHFQLSSSKLGSANSELTLELDEYYKQYLRYF